MFHGKMFPLRLRHGKARHKKGGPRRTLEEPEKMERDGFGGSCVLFQLLL